MPREGLLVRAARRLSLYDPTRRRFITIERGQAALLPAPTSSHETAILLQLDDAAAVSRVTVH